MRKLIRALAVAVVILAIVVYAREARMSFNRWSVCGGDRGQPSVLGESVDFGWNPAGIFSDVLYVGGKPAARLVKYHFRLVDDVIEVASLDGAATSRYCGK